MTGRVPRATQSRGVSDIIGVVILIAMAIAGAIVVVAMGGMALTDIDQQTSDDLAQDSFREVDSRFAELAEQSVDTTTSFTFPDSAGTGLSARPENGSVTITVSATRAGTHNRTCRMNSTLGTLEYENRDSTLVAYQGGGLWRQTSGVTQVQSPPGLDYNGQTIDLSFVDISSFDSIENEITASKNVTGSREQTAAMQENMSACWELEDAPGTVPIDIELTIESQFADGWATYAMEGMQHPLNESDLTTGGVPLTTATLEDVRENGSVTLHLGSIGETNGVATTPRDFPDKIIYSGLSRYAKFNSEIYPTGNAPNEMVVDRNGNVGFGVYHPKYDSWFSYRGTHWKNEGSGSPNQLPTLPWVGASSIGPAELPGGMSNVTGTHTVFDLVENASVCVAENPGQINAANCEVNMTGISSNNPSAPYEDEKPHYEVDINTTASVTEGELLNVTVEVKNTGDADGEKHVFLGDFSSTLVGYKENVSVAQGGEETITLQWPTTIGDAGTGNITVEAEGGDSYDTKNVTIHPATGNASQFDVSIDSASNNVTLGNTVSVDVTVTNTGNATDTQWVVLEDFDGHPVAAKKVDLSDGSSKARTLEWQTRAGDGGSGNVTVKTLNDDATANVTVDGSSDTGGVVYVGPAGASGADEYFETAYNGTAYATEDDTNNGGNCQGGEVAYDGGCLDDSVTTKGYILDEYGNESYDLYAGDVDTGTWNYVDRNGNGPHRYVNSDDDGSLPNDNRAYNHYNVSDDQPVCLAETGESIDPAEDCGPILNVSGSMDYNPNNYLDVNATGANLSLLTAQVGHVREEEYNVRLPMDVFFVLDESGSMGYPIDWVSRDSTILDPSAATDTAVPENEIWNFDIGTFYAGEAVSSTIINSSDWVEIYDIPHWYGSDAAGSRITATKSFIGSLNDTLDRAGALQFDTGVTTMHGLTGNLDAVNETLDIDPGGKTNIAGGIYEAKEELTVADRQNQVIVLLSDGQHNTGGNPVYAAEQADKEGIIIHTIGLGAGANEEQLEDIADATGGSYHYVSSPDDLPDIFDDIADNVTEQRLIQRGRTTVTAVGESQNWSVNLADSSNLNDPNYFNTTGSTSIATQLESGLENADLSFEMTVNSCEEYNTTNVTSAKDGEQYVHATCENPDLSSETTIDNSSITNHVIVTENNSNTLDDIETSDWWQPAPSSLDAMDPYTDGGGNVDLDDGEAIIGLEITESNQTGYVLLHFAVNKTEQVRDDWEGDTREQPEFAVGDLSTNSPVEEGDTLTVDAQITNVGDTKGTQYVVLRADGYVVDTKGVTDLAAGATETVTFSWPTARGDASVSQVAVSTRDHTASTPVDIEAPDRPQFNITGEPLTNSPVTAGNALSVTATIKNTGNTQGTRIISLENRDDDRLDVNRTTLSAGESTPVTLTWRVPVGVPAGPTTLTINAVDSSKPVSVEIEASESGGSTMGGGDIGLDPIDIELTKIEIES